MRTFQYLPTSPLLSLLLILAVEARMNRPEPTFTCGENNGIYGTLSEAEEACVANNGVMYMWGESFSEGTAFVSDTNETGYRASVGPFWCTRTDPDGACNTTNTGGPGFGYVGNTTSLPDLVSVYTQTNNTGIFNGIDVCHEDGMSLIAKKVPEDITCSALQRHCEDLNLGWLIFAKSFKTAHGEMLCSGGCKDRLDITDNYSGYHQIEVPEGYTNLLAWPLLLMYALSFALVIVASKMDYALFMKKQEEGRGSDCHWHTSFILESLGYIDEEGKVQSLKEQMCGYCNPFKTCLSCCRCCFCCCCFCCRDSRDDAFKFMKTWLDILSVFILSLGVALLFGGGVMHEPVCYFNALPSSGTMADDLDYSNYFDSLFNATGFSYSSLYSRDVTMRIFDWPWWTSEVLIVLFSRSQVLLVNGYIGKGNVAQLRILSLMVILSVVVTGGAAYLTWEDFKTATLLLEWIIGFIFGAYFLVPLFMVISYYIAQAMVKCLKISEESLLKKKGNDEEEADQGDNPTPQPTAGQQPTYFPIPTTAPQDVSGMVVSLQGQNERTFKVYVPDGMSPGENLSVLNPKTEKLFKTIVPSRDQWIIEATAVSDDKNPQDVTKPFFNVMFQ